jgi:hypothetical protein
MNYGKPAERPQADEHIKKMCPYLKPVLFLENQAR